MRTRRAFITLLGGAAAAWPLTARAQNSGKIVRIGMLTTANPRSASFIQAFEQSLRDLGYIEGQNMVIEFRNAEGQVDRLPELAADQSVSARTLSLRPASPQLVSPRKLPLRSPFSWWR
jgi:putative tryptophan/tyrosine transport system substrate-binding protein